jgi:hypothetical protein
LQSCGGQHNQTLSNFEVKQSDLEMAKKPKRSAGSKGAKKKDVSREQAVQKTIGCRAERIRTFVRNRFKLRTGEILTLLGGDTTAG